MPKKLDPTKLLEKQSVTRAAFDKSSIDEQARRVTLLISTEEPIRMTDWYSGEKYDEVLLHGAENIDLERASTAKLRYMHGYGKYGELPIGRLENVRIENKQLRADAIFSEANPDAEMLWRMVLEGTMTEISVGGKKQEVRITERSGDVPLVEVLRWEFQEASLVDVGADKNAGIGRSENTINQEKKDVNMDQVEELKRQLAALEGEKADVEAIQRKQKELDDEIKRVNDENIDLKRKEGINALNAQFAGIMPKEDVERFLGDKEMTAETFSLELLNRQAKQQNEVSFQAPTAGGADVTRVVADSLLLRFGVPVKTPHENANVYRNASMLDVARAITGYDGYDNNELVTRAMSSDDFPILLGNVANRIMATSFEEAEGTYHLWAQIVEVKDFREITEVLPDGIGGRFQKTKEHGENKNTEFGEGSEKWRIESFSEEITITRKMLINDDFGVFQTIIAEWGKKAKRTVNGHVYDLLQKRGEYANFAMGDGLPLFEAAKHKNYTASGTALSSAALTAARVGMRRQTDKKGVALNINPKFLFVSPENETTALQLLNSEADVGGSNSGVTNPHKGSLTPIVDAEIDALPWFLAASTNTVKVGFLMGTNKGPIIAEKQRTLSSVTLEVVFDFGVTAVNHRGLYKNNGAA